MIPEKFSKRHGFTVSDVPIQIREDAPTGLRQFLIATIYYLEKKPSFLRDIVCRELRVTADLNNWSEWPNIAHEVQCLIDNCEWYKVYDIIESVSTKFGHDRRFESEINDYFKANGIGWKLESDKIIFRGDDFFEINLKNAEEVLEQAGKKTARTEIKEAISDLSRKPHADITGAIQHSLACLECISREIANDRKSTLGDLIRRNRTIIPPPLDVVIEKAWGYSSERGRHLQEGNDPQFDEAELLVTLAAGLSTYMARKLPEMDAPEFLDSGI